MKINFDELKWFGRTIDLNNVRYFDYSASGFAFSFTGTKAECTVLSDPEKFDGTTKGVIGVYVSEGTDLNWKSLPDELTYRYSLEAQENKCVLFESAEPKTVTIRVIKLSEVNFGCAGLKELEIEGQVVPSEFKTDLKMEVIGDSITCGYGIEGVWEKDTFTTQQERADKSYAFLTAKKLNAEFQCCSWSGIGLISKYVDPATATKPDTTISMPLLWPYTDKSLQMRLGMEPETWEYSKFQPDVVIIHLGTNDASFVQQKEDRRLLYVHQLRVLIEAVHRRSPQAKICCCLGVMGQDLCDSVSEAVELFKGDFKKAVVKAVKLPVQLESDGIAADWHPSAATHEKVAAQLADAIKNW